MMYGYDDRDKWCPWHGRTALPLITDTKLASKVSKNEILWTNKKLKTSERPQLVKSQHFHHGVFNDNCWISILFHAQFRIFIHHCNPGIPQGPKHNGCIHRGAGLFFSQLQIFLQIIFVQISWVYKNLACGLIRQWQEFLV